MCNAPNVSFQAWKKSVSYIENILDHPGQYELSKVQHHLDVYNSYCSVQQAKQTIMHWDSRRGDVKQLISQYLYYITNRSADDKLTVGRDIHQCYSNENYAQHIKRVNEKWTILALHGYKCVMCGEEHSDSIKLELRHIEKLSETHNRDITNLAPLCHKCHCEAHANDPTVVHE